MKKKLGVFLLFISPLLSNKFDNCGKVNRDPNSHFAIDGSRRDINAPWLAAVGRCENNCGKDDAFTVSCSGGILTKKHIVTAAHCFTEIGVVKKEHFPNYVKVGVTTIDSKFAEDRMIKEYKGSLHFKILLLENSISGGGGSTMSNSIIENKYH